MTQGKKEVLGKYKQHCIQEVKSRHAFSPASATAKSSQHNQSQLGPRKMTPYPVDVLLGTMWMKANEDWRVEAPWLLPTFVQRKWKLLIQLSSFLWLARGRP